MTSKVPYRISELDLNNIYYSDIKSNSKKTIVYIKYMDDNKMKNFVFQTPTLLSKNTVTSKKDIYEIDIPLDGKDKDKITRFSNFLESIDRKIIRDAKNNNKWFEKFANVKKMKYQKIIRDDDNRGVIRLKILKTTDFETLLHINNKKAPIEEITADSWVKCILEVYAIWINENGFGLFIRPVVMSFKPCMKLTYNYKLIEDSDENEVEEIAVDTVQDNSIFIRSESEITSSALELSTLDDETPSSEKPVENVDIDLDSATSSTEK
jgi:hypothetical protein